ncbi:hypothetical protein A4X13_0g4423 [Tilletia indica]|uniref:Uncharacterized protein n=1 Tax=Tilletia indica TaxID=43049 RepID=A0A177T8M2_9BASI|nr:hypothetical protein A4X13_0g4423 [Tilletia indica]
MPQNNASTLNQHPREALKVKQLHFRELLRQQRLYRRSEPPLPHAVPQSPPPSMPYQLSDIHLADRLRALDAMVTQQASTFEANRFDHGASLMILLAELDVLCALAASRHLKDLRLKHFFPAKAVDIVNRIKKHAQNLERIYDMSFAEYNTAIEDAQAFPYIDGAVDLHQQHLEFIQQSVPLLPDQLPTLSPLINANPAPSELPSDDGLDRLHRILRNLRRAEEKLIEFQRRPKNTEETSTALMSTMQQLDTLCVNLLDVFPSSLADCLYLTPVVKTNFVKLATFRRNNANPTCETAVWRNTVKANEDICSRVYEGGLLDDLLMKIHATAHSVSLQQATHHRHNPPPRHQASLLQQSLSVQDFLPWYVDDLTSHNTRHSWATTSSFLS